MLIKQRSRPERKGAERMKSGQWVKTVDRIAPYIEWSSLEHHLRTAWEPTRHSNGSFELHIVLEGTGRIELEEQIVELHAGQALIIPPNTFHTCCSITTPFLRLTASFLLTDPTQMTRFAGERANHIVLDVDAPTRRLCMEIFEEYDRSAAYLSDEMLCAQFSQLVIRVLRAVRSGQPQERIRHQTSMLNIIDRYFSGSHMQGRCTRRELAQRLHCSERQLNRILTELYGMTFLEKRLQARMDYAKYLLRSTDRKIPEISAMVGYANETSFYKVFKANCGVTPKEFRGKYR